MKWFKKKRIIVPFDYSDDSLRAVRVGMALSETKSQVHVVHVLYDLLVGEHDSFVTAVDNSQRAADAKRAIGDQLAVANIEGIKVDVLVGDPATEIVELANEIETDLIVIPSHGYAGIKRMLLGSVAQDVVRHAKCPVLVLKE